MNKRLILFSTMVAATGLIFFIAWQVIHAVVAPPAAQAVAEEGVRLPSYQVLAVDLIGLRSVWLAWALAAMLGYWYLEKSAKRSGRSAMAVFALYVVPLVTTSVVLLSIRR